MMSKLAVIVAFLSLSEAFVANQPRCFRPATKLFLEDHIADMIDKELVRLANKQEADREWKRKNDAVLEQKLPQGFDFEEATVMEHVMAPRQQRKDKRLAKDDPRAYCADRCIATGNCEVFEDMCVECVLHYIVVTWRLCVTCC